MSNGELAEEIRADCEHEIDLDGPIEGGDWEDINRFRAACVWVQCKHCGCRGLSVDDTGDFWEGENGELIT